ncbi:tetratricopeptide repeat protein [Mucilaginibacter terrigena]|uniref:histidine kinase n=1 Tax=Mucilaginibacter terrigena TaxID=2492395 RepID=A0A4Q5LKC4_9SPHI|nr:sensor histidine kinase [Mucilaginibacter terrigena]RYU89270.1 tetratricopeptide repeat protein [Mucilaginibacter terrigena]
MHKLKFALVLLLSFLLSNAFAQDKVRVDSLVKVLKTTKQDTVKAKVYYNLMMEYVDADSALAIKYANSGMALALKSHADKILGNIQNNLGTFYNFRGERRISDSLINLALSTRLRIKDSLGAAYSLMNLGHNNYDQNSYVNALRFYTEAARIRAKINDKKGLAGSYIWIGNVYYEGIINYPRALEYHGKALEIYKELNDELGQSYAYSNMANVYMEQKDYDRSLKYNLASLKLKLKLNNVRGIGVLYNNIGNMYFYSGKPDKALPYYYKSLEIRKSQDDKIGVATSYVNIGNVYLDKNDLAKAQDLMLKAIAISKELNFKVGLRDGYLSLFTIYNRKKDYPKAIEYFKLHTDYKDSTMNEASAKQIAEIQTKYETEKKEERINLLNKQTLIQQLKIDKRNTTIFIICCIFIVFAAFAYLFYNRYRLKQAAILQAEVMRQQDMATKSIIEAEENERRRIAGDLHDGVGQLLSATRMNFDTLLERLNIADTETRELADKTMAMVDESCKEVRTIAHQMMPNVLLKLGLTSALRDFVNKIDSHRLKIVLDVAGLANRLDSSIEIVLYRVIQETVNNVIKHAKASLLDIQLQMEGDEVSVTIEDNGRGFDTSDKEKFEGIGLKNIITRVEYLKGTVDISSSPGKGTLVAILIPLN